MRRLERTGEAHGDRHDVLGGDPLDPIALREEPGQYSITMYGRPSAEIPA
jgi:hypothetical protein